VLVEQHELIPELRRARSELIELLASTLELDLKLLHSTEADATVISRQHGEFEHFIDTLTRHMQHPHVQQYSDMNHNEFGRAELDFLNQYLREIRDRNKALRELLLIQSRSYTPEYSMQELIERMAETRREGRPNQFTEAQRTTIIRLLDPEQYYGRKIAADFFADSVSLSTDGEPINETTSISESEMDANETAMSLLRMKAQVTADRLADFEGVRKRVFATALLKVKACMANDPSSTLDSGVSDLSSALARGTTAPAVELVSAKPRDLVFVYHGKGGNKAVFHCGLSNAILHRFVPGTVLPLLTRPSASLLLVKDRGSIVGHAFVACRTADDDTIGQLALLIKSLDFTNEFMKLASQPDSDAQARGETATVDAELLTLAEEL
jgi:hypothetical protein